MYYAIERRRHEDSLFWEFADESQQFAITKGVALQSHIILQEEYGNDEAELNDFQGSALGSIVTKKLHDLLVSFDLPGLSLKECIIENYVTNETLFYLTLSNRIANLLDTEKSQVYFRSSTGNDVREIFKVELNPTVHNSLDESSLQAFCFAEYPQTIIVNEPIASQIATLSPTGLRLFPLHSWFTGIESEDEYLVGDIEKEDLDSIICDTVLKPYIPYNPEKRGR